METIQSLFNLRQPNAPQVRLGDLISNTKIGVEVEVENLPNPPYVNGWKCTRDGSLRNNGVEYVFKGPVGGLSACNRLASLQNTLFETECVHTLRTSVHVHVDARDMTWHQVKELLILYAIVEPYLFSICGTERADNIYALSLYRGQHQVSQLCDILEGGHELINRRWTKYTALNLTALSTFGSLEFRGHHGTCSKDVLVNWINHLLKLKEYVMNPRTSVTHFPNMMSSQGPHAVLSAIFGEDLVNANISQFVGIEDVMYESIWIAENLIHNSPMLYHHNEIKRNNNGHSQLEKVKDKLCAV